MYKDMMGDNNDFHSVDAVCSLFSFPVSRNYIRVVLDDLTNRGFVDASKASVIPHFRITPQGIRFVEDHSSDRAGIVFRVVRDGTDFLEDSEGVLDFEADAEGVAVPASDRIVALDHNSQTYQETVRSLDQVIEEVRRKNDLGDVDPSEKERVLTELSLGRKLLESAKVRVAAAGALLLGGLKWVIEKFAEGSIQTAASAAYEALKVLLGL
jgi:hypothetical protein